MADKKKILVVEIVEDSRELAAALSNKLVGEGYEVAKLTNGKTGLEWALANHPDVILLDLQMPIMDGKAMSNELRQDEWGANVPVVIMTNASDITTMNEVISIVNNKTANHGLNDYFIKSDTSLETISELIKEKTSSIH